MFGRKINFYFIFGLILLFVLEATPGEQWRIVTGALYSTIICVLIYTLGWLTLEGGRAATILGTITFGVGGFYAALIMLLFFITSSLISKEQDATQFFERRMARRDELQVWANGFWFALLLMVWFTLDKEVWLYAALASLAVATADTWATEIGGNRIKGKTWLITSLKRVDPGMDGAISIAGTLASLAGSLIIAMASAMLYPGNKIIIFATVLVAGFLGSLADSLYGALIQNRTLSFDLPGNYSVTIPISNNLVNWLATGTGSLLIIIFSWIY